ncbi:DUF2924 family protein [Stella humosa]|uniref:DUF2924 family protein n=1 Tax=Stella humosa TaxID=94 RepID=A0A3N1KWV4_9PROT|nr:DUF2924 domain-containing protein [Stella humosa]ROP83952.1 DUF2924 family protein [Stella humosa]BBK33460.1 hypothetical protein STHU_40940 [Stella humosa]
MRRSRQSSVDGELEAALRRLQTLDAEALRHEWQRLYGNKAPRLGINLLRGAVAHRLREQAHGGLSPALRRRLREALETGGKTAGSPSLKPGTRLIREWNAVTHEVLVINDGFVWRGQRYASLTAIAREITGTHWSGPRFFGLVRGKGGSRG